jgi:hypothetical protein
MFAGAIALAQTKMVTNETFKATTSQGIHLFGGAFTEGGIYFSVPVSLYQGV